jgi:dihydropteroate synthase
MNTPTVELVGILNVTPDSFFDGDKYLQPQHALFRAYDLFKHGASFIDVGAEATNPWAEPITAEEEWSRLQPILPQLLDAHPNQISLDTRHAKTAERALKIAPVILNDVTMFRDPAMVRVAAAYEARCIVSHIPTADIKAAHRDATLNDVAAVRDDLLAKREELIAAGVPAENIILDPGIGFGKTMDLNIELLRFAEEVPDIPVMIGYSNKRLIAVMSGLEKTNIAANLAAARIAIESGARYLRVHNVDTHKQYLDSIH